MTAVAEFHSGHYSSRGNGIPLFQRDLRKGNYHAPPGERFKSARVYFGRVKYSNSIMMRKKKAPSTNLERALMRRKMLPASGNQSSRMHVCYALLLASLLFFYGTQFNPKRPRVHWGSAVNLVVPEGDNKPSSARGHLTCSDSAL